jgi:hypothetical protein
VILVWGLREDTTTASVLDRLDIVGGDVVLLDQRELLGPGLLTADLQLSCADGVQATLSLHGEQLDLALVSAAYVRPYDPRAFPAVIAGGPGSPVWSHAMSLDDLLWSWADVSPAQVVNRPSAMAPNGSKPFQARQILESGFAVPQTLITTDAAAAEEFWRRHGQVVYKSISGVRSIVSRLQPLHERRWSDIATCPVQFQQYVPGVDHRVHVVGAEVFCTEVVSEADDYRYAAEQGATAYVRPAALPPPVADRCRRLARALGLSVAGIDLRRTPAGEWYCFEVNPSPAFSYFDDERRSVAGAVADLLVTAPQAPGDGWPEAVAMPRAGLGRRAPAYGHASADVTQAHDGNRRPLPSRDGAPATAPMEAR